MKTTGGASATLAVAEIGSRFDGACPDLEWLERIRLSARGFLAANPKRRGAQHLQWAHLQVQLAQAAIAKGDAQGAALAAMGALQSAWQAELTEASVMIGPGVKRYRKSEDTNLTRATEAATEHEKWQKAANKAWRSNRGLSSVAVSKQIAPDFPDVTFNTIRQSIKKPKK